MSRNATEKHAARKTIRRTFAISFAPVLVVLVMVVLPLALSFPEFILNSMENAYIDECGLPGQRAAILFHLSMGFEEANRIICFRKNI